MMNYLYIETGSNFEDILRMDYWRFRGILYTLNKIHTIKSGKTWVEKGVPQSSKDMIAKRKAQR
jgi:hypothetical protein